MTVSGVWRAGKAIFSSIKNLAVTMGISKMLVKQLIKIADKKMIAHMIKHVV